MARPSGDLRAIPECAGYSSRMKRFFVKILYALAGLSVIACLALAGGYVWLRGSLPQTEGELTIAALASPVEVLRDGDGIVTIRARSERDAALALGYVHAQDRLWQMDFMRRSGAGRLSEVIGPKTFHIDRFMRILGLYRVAEANERQLSAPVRDLLTAYAEGVNAFIEEPGGPLPLEFQLLNYTPEPWRPADSLVWGRLMALQLSGNWSEELRRARLAQRLTPQQIAFLWPGYPADGPVTIGDLAAWTEGLPLKELAEILPWELAPKSASNSWVVAGAHTQSGLPVLANDPHLALTAPGVWYLARIETPELTLTGATAPGMPFMMLGHNGSIAWGFTNTHSDTQDLFIERLAKGDPGQYLTPEGPRPFETRDEVIGIGGSEARKIVVRATRHGPVLSDTENSRVTGVVKAGTVLALAWPALDPGDRTADALYAMNRARDWPGFHRALENFHSPQQNIVYADTSGAIAFIAPGRVPIRKGGDGRAPVPGWNGDYDWIGEIPFEELPLEVNPPSGRIVAANNKIVPDDYPYLIAADWPGHYRAQQIKTRLDENSHHHRSADGARELQQDIVAPDAGDLLPLLLKTEPTTERGRYALDLLAGWDGRMDRNEAAPLVYYAWMRALNRVLLADELGGDFAGFQRPQPDLLLRLLSEGQVWCDDITTQEREGCAGQMNAALEDALNTLALRFHKPADRLRWGEAHLARFAHPVLSRLPWAGALFDGIFGYGVETDGATFTVNKGGISFNGPSERLFENIHGPGYRAVYDLAALDQSRFMIATGQSGNPLSPHYGSLALRWRDGDYVKLVGRETPPAGRLRLSPN